jgi:hypothetical protein
VLLNQVQPIWYKRTQFISVWNRRIENRTWVSISIIVQPLRTHRRLPVVNLTLSHSSRRNTRSIIRRGCILSGRLKKKKKIKKRVNKQHYLRKDSSRIPSFIIIQRNSKMISTLHLVICDSNLDQHCQIPTSSLKSQL